jgi:hypothetical protein
MDKKAAVPIYLKIARYRPKAIKIGSEKLVADINTNQCLS